MNIFSLPALTAWLLLPILFALIVPAVRRLTDQSLPDDGTEKWALGIMLAPFGLGLALLPLASAFPNIVPATALLPDGDGLPAGGVSITDRPAPAGPDLSFLLWTLPLALYAGIALFKIGKVLLARRELAQTSLKAEAHEEGIRLTRDLQVPVVDEKGTILLPEALSRQMSAEEKALVVAHERAHHARGDQRYFIVLALIDAVFWLHPGLRWQTARCRLAAELACDRAACGQSPELRKAYAELIVRALKHAAGSALPCAPAVFSPRTKGEFGMRLTEIMRPRAQSNKRAGMILALAAALAVPLGAGQIASAQMSSQSTEFTVTPVEDGRVTSRWGPRKHPQTKERQRHFGTDIAAPMGTPVRAPGLGVVTRAEEVGKYGYLMEVTHAGDIVTRYAQLEGFEVEVGTKVWAGDTIARVGSSGASTGPHLHLEVFVDGKRVDPETLIPMP